jgi:iodotyrosine deiodinase
MGSLGDLLGRPAHERPFLLLIVGHPTEDAVVPVVAKKPFDEIVRYHRGER